MNERGTRLGSRVVTIVVVVLTLTGLAIHGWFAAGAGALDSDRALVLLMARHFARGEFSVYFWQQNYMGALEPLLLTPLALLGWATPASASIVAIALTAALATIAISLTQRLGGVPWMTLLMWAVPPAVVVQHHVALYGARLVATLLAVAAFALSLRARRLSSWIAVGVLIGVAYFGDHLMLTWAAATMYVAGKRSGLRGLAMGAAPVVIFDTAAALMTPAFHLSGPNSPGSWFGNVPLLFGTTIPQLFGLLLGRAPGPLFEPASSVVPTDPRWLLFAVPGAVVICLLIATLVRYRRAVFDSRADVAGLGAQGLVLACVVAVALFVFTGGGGDRWPVRYLVPLWPAVSVLAAIAVARWRPELRVAGALVVLPALFTLFADHSWPRGNDGDAARAEAVAVGTAIQQSGARAVWADYWETYRMALLIGESPPWVALRIIERRPDWARDAETASPVAYLLRDEDAEVLQRVNDAKAQGVIRSVSSEDVGRYHLVVTDRSVPGLVIMNGAPPRAKQMLAAFASGLLFLGTFASLWLFAIRNQSRPPENSSSRQPFTSRTGR